MKPLYGKWRDLRRSSAATLVLAAGWLTSPPTLDARQSIGTDLNPGVRVRALDAEGHELGDGVLRTVTRDSIRLQSPGGEPHDFARGDVSTLELHTGTSRRWMAGGAIGLVAGLGTLAAREFFDSACALSVNGECAHAQGRNVFPNTDASVIVGTAVLLGVAVGSLIRSDRWRAVLWPTLTPSPDGTGALDVSLRIAWG